MADAAGLPQPVTVITRLRLDAALYDPAPPRAPGTKGRPRVKGERQPTLATRLLDPDTVWETLTVPWYGGGTAQVEVATGTAIWYHAGSRPSPCAGCCSAIRPGSSTRKPCSARTRPCPRADHRLVRRPLAGRSNLPRSPAHLGVETQRQWSDFAILRTTPALLGLFSLVTLFAQARLHGQPLPVRQAAWYTKPAPTFSDTLAFVRQHLWPVTVFSTSPSSPDVVEIPRALFDRLTDTLAFAA